MRHVIVTGANKGIGLAIARGVLADHHDTVLWLGSRDPDRGRQAIQRLAADEAGWAARIQLLEIDVADDDAVAAAARHIDEHTREPLYGLVNNAGTMGDDLGAVLQVNTFGVHRVCEAFGRKLASDGRIVNVTSGSGPMFVASCSEERQAFFTDPSTGWSELVELMEAADAAAGDPEAMAELGLPAGEAYGLSKACANTYTQWLAQQHPGLTVNACTPGWIATDMTRPMAEARGEDPYEMGMKTPEQGAQTPLFLLFGDVSGSGHYYGSDGQRSPMHRYRSPGDPPYTGP